MLKYILKRLAYTVFVIIGVSFITFYLLKLAPGDPARLMVGRKRDRGADCGHAHSDGA